MLLSVRDLCFGAGTEWKIIHFLVDVSSQGFGEAGAWNPPCRESLFPSSLSAPWPGALCTFSSADEFRSALCLPAEFERLWLIGAPLLWVIGEESLEVAGDPRLLQVPAASGGARSVGRAGTRRCPQVCGAEPQSRRLCSLPPGCAKKPLPKGALGALMGERINGPCADNDELSDFQQRLQSIFSFSPPASPPHTIAAQPSPASGACQISRPRSLCSSWSAALCFPGAPLSLALDVWYQHSKIPAGTRAGSALRPVFNPREETRGPAAIRAEISGQPLATFLEFAGYKRSR